MFLLFVDVDDQDDDDDDEHLSELKYPLLLTDEITVGYIIWWSLSGKVGKLYSLNHGGEPHALQKLHCTQFMHVN